MVLRYISILNQRKILLKGYFTIHSNEPFQHRFVRLAINIIPEFLQDKIPLSEVNNGKCGGRQPHLEATSGRNGGEEERQDGRPAPLEC